MQLRVFFIIFFIYYKIIVDLELTLNCIIYFIIEADDVGGY